MALTGLRLPLRRINPFQGLMIDTATWQDAHEYHRDQLRLHHQALHGFGIIQGLDVSVGGTDNTLVIEPGVAVDPEGNFVVLTQAQRYRVQSRERGTVYLIMQFREVLSEPSGNGTGQPTRIVEAFRIQERDQLPSEAYIELARIDYDPGGGPIAAPRNAEHPRRNELDLRSRVNIGTAAAPLLSAQALAAAALPSASEPAEPAPVPVAPIAPAVAAAPPPAPEPTVSAPPAGEPPPVAAAPLPVPAVATLTLAVAAHGGAGWDAHRQGLRFLAREVQTAAGRPAQALDSRAPAEAEAIDFIYMSGYGRVELGEAEVAGLARALERGAVVVGDGCAHGPNGEAGAREFAFSFAQVAQKLGRQLAQVERGHALLVGRHVFSSSPAGALESARVLEAGGMVLCSADYGCAWAGGPPDRPLPRAAIRDATEFGVNLALYRSAAITGT